MDQAPVRHQEPRWASLLKEATVALSVEPSSGGPSVVGTGFFITPTIVVTCAHVIADDPAALPARVTALTQSGRGLQLKPVADWLFRNKVTGLDVALLHVADDAWAHSSGKPQVLLSGVMELGDELWAYGHPVGMFRAGQPATFRYEGDSRRSTEDDLPLPRLRGTPVSAGFSGSAVINHRTGAVCGMLCTSDQSGGAHLVSASDILARFPVTQERPAPYLSWLRTLSDAQLRAGGWRFAGPNLRAYLSSAAAGAVQSNPYADGKPGPAPPLSSVYVPQDALEHIPPEGKAATASQHDEARKYRLETILEGEDDCLIVGGPGAGKSSLLRAELIRLAQKWLHDEPCESVPVRVLAADLVPQRPLPEALADGVNADLSAWLRERLPSELFSLAPTPGSRWLVLIDGLDEIMRADQRLAVLTRLANMRVQGHAVTHRFVVAARPVADAELVSNSEWQHKAYELLPFDDSQLSGLAEAWFTALGLKQPVEAAKSFTADIERAGLMDIARVPLMATMLCRTYVANPEAPLPIAKHDVYRRFTELLIEHKYSDDIRGVHKQIQAAVAKYPQATDIAEKLHDRVNESIPRLALARYDGAVASAVELVGAWTAELRPPEKEGIFSSLIPEILRRSGLLIETRGDFDFIHHTILEFLAAKAIASDKLRNAEAFQALFGRTPMRTLLRWRDSFSRVLHSRRQVVTELFYRLIQYENPDDRGDDDLAPLQLSDFLIGTRDDDKNWALAFRQSVSRRGRVLWSLWARDESSVTRFLLAEWGSRRDLNKILWPKNREEAQFVVMLAADGIPLDRGVIETASGILYAVAANRSRRGRVRAATVLGRYDPRGADLLSALAADSEFGGHDRVRAAKALDWLGDSRGADAWASIAVDPGLYDLDRLDAAKALCAQGDRRCADTWAAMVAEADLDGWARVHAADALGKAGDPRGPEALASLAVDADLSADDRFRAAGLLEELGDARAADAYANFAEDSDRDGYYRVPPAEALVRLGDPRGLEALAEVGADPRGDFEPRFRAAQALHELRDPRSVEILAVLSAEAQLETISRIRAAETLGQMRDPRGVDVLARLAAEAEPHPQPQLETAPVPRRRGRLASWVMRMVENRWPELFADPDPVEPPLDSFPRIRAAEALGRLHDPRGPEMLASQALEPDPAADPKVDIFRRIYASEALGRLHDPRGPDTLARFMSDPELRVFHFKIAERLQRLGDPRGKAWLDRVAALTGIVLPSDDW